MVVEPARPKRHCWPKGRPPCTWAHRCLDCRIPLAEQKRNPQPCTPLCAQCGMPWAEHTNHADGWEQRMPQLAKRLA